MISTRIAIPAATLALGTALGLGVGWKLYRGKAAPVETAAPQVRQQDQSLILQRQPSTDAKPAQEIPKGSVPERIVKVYVQPKIQSLPSIPTSAQRIPGSGTPSQPKPIEVDLTLVRQKDGAHRVIASSPDGTIVGGIDVSTGPTIKTKTDLKWEAGVLYSPFDRTYGAYVHRNVGPFVVGFQASQQRLPACAGGGLKLEGMISVGVRW